jgi:hypothetical protein
METAMPKAPKTYKVIQHRRGKELAFEGTLSELVETFSYTLKCGASYQHEKGNKKINRNPKTIASLVSNLTAAKNNAAANGYSDTYYTVEQEGVL